MKFKEFVEFIKTQASIEDEEEIFFPEVNVSSNPHAKNIDVRFTTQLETGGEK